MRIKNRHKKYYNIIHVRRCHQPVKSDGCKIRTFRIVIDPKRKIQICHVASLDKRGLNYFIACKFTQIKLVYVLFFGVDANGIRNVNRSEIGVV